MTNKNTKRRRRASYRTQTIREIEAAEAVLAIERRETEASYVSRGSLLQFIDASALQRLWADCAIRELTSSLSTDLQDICAELSLRGLEQGALPPDLIELVTAEVRKPCVPKAVIGVSAQRPNRAVTDFKQVADNLRCGVAD
jgi:hypothetical protein